MCFIVIFLKDIASDGWVRPLHSDTVLILTKNHLIMDVPFPYLEICVLKSIGYVSRVDANSNKIMCQPIVHQ
mgnify:CR=1 FL=1